jgi:chromosome segregation ATPase
MTRLFRGWIILLVGALCIWGCTQSSGTGSTKTEKVKSLEEKLAKLEDENKSVAVARDQLRKKLIETEEQKLKIQREFEEQQGANVRERDDLKSQLASRTNERDSLQVQFDLMRKSLRNILSQADTISASFPKNRVTAAADSAQHGGF